MKFDTLKFTAGSICALATIWGVTTLYLVMTKDAYTTEWTMIVASGNNSSSVSVGDLGNASSTSQGPSGETDPRSNYKIIASSPEVVNIAAKTLSMSPEQFGTPEVKLVDPASVLEFSIEGKSAAESLRKAQALIMATQLKVNNLRLQEVRDKEKTITAKVSSAKSDLDRSQMKLAQFKAETGFISSDQASIILNTLRDLKQQKVALLSQKSASEGQLNQLSQDLRTTTGAVTSSFSIQSNPYLQKLIASYSELSSQLVTLTSKFSDNHPTVISTRAELANVKQQMLQAASQAVGRPVSESELTSLVSISPTSSSTGAGDKQSLYNGLISTKGQLAGVNKSLNTLNQEIAKTEFELSKAAVNQPRLETLEREVKFKELLYTSVLGKAGLSGTEIYANYPLIQLLSTPQLPEDPSSPKVGLALAGAGLASILTISALGLLWFRSRGVTGYKKERIYPGLKETYEPTKLRSH